MGRQPAENYPWNKRSNHEENDISSRCSFGSLSRSTSEDDSSTPNSPRAVDPEHIEAQLVLSEKEAYLTEGYEKRQSILWEQATNRHYSRSEADKGDQPDSPPWTIRWRESQPQSTMNPSSSSRSLGSWISSSTATSTPPPPALRSSRRLSLPGAFPVAGMNSDGYNGEEEKFEDEASIWPSSERDEHDEELLVEATLVTERSKSDSQLNSADLVFQAEPLDERRRFTLKSICCLVCLLLVIAVFGVAAGTELGRRRYEETPDEVHPPRDPLEINISNSTFTFAPTTELNTPVSYSGSFSPEQVMEAPTQDDTNALAPTAPPSPNSKNDTITDFVRDVLPDKTRKSLEDPRSPQSFAYEWLSADPNLSRRPSLATIS